MYETQKPRCNSAKDDQLGRRSRLRRAKSIEADPNQSGNKGPNHRGPASADGGDDQTSTKMSSQAASKTAPNSLLDWLDGSHGKAALALTATLAAVASVFTNASLGLVVLLGPAALALLAILVTKRRRRTLTVLTIIGLLTSIVLALRFYSKPETISFLYGGDLMDNSKMPYADLAGIPLTSDPAKGYVYYEVLPIDAVEFEVACTRVGRFNNGKQSAELEWAYVADGAYETLWVPMPFVRAFGVGQARTLLPCSHWRWQLNSPGR